MATRTPTSSKPLTAPSKLRSFRVRTANMDWLERKALAESRSPNNLLNAILEQVRMDDERAQALAASTEEAT